MSRIWRHSCSRNGFRKFACVGMVVMMLGALLGACSSPVPVPTQAPAPAPTKAPAAQAPQPAAAQPTQAPQAAAPAGKITARMASVIPGGGAAEKAALEFAKWMKDRTNGRLEVQVFFNGQLGGERDMVESMQMGSIEMSVFGSYLMSNVAPEWGLILDTPYVLKSQEQFRKVVDGPLTKPMYDAILERKGIRHIAWENRGPRYLTSNKPVKVPADMKGVKIRVPEVETYVSAWKMLGATVTPMALPEVFLALKQGTVDAEENSYEMIYGSSYFEVQKYLNQTSHILSGYEPTVSEKWFKSLSPDMQKTVTDGLAEMAKLEDKMQAEDESGYESKLKEKGMIFNPVDLDKFQEALKDMPKEFASKWKPGFFEEVKAVK